LVKLKWMWVIVVAAAGCGKSEQTAQMPASRPSTTTTAPSTLPAGPGKMVLGEETLVFPPSRLTIQVRQDTIEGVLTSEVHSAVDEKPNAIFLQLNLDLPDGNSLSGATADFKATSRERVDSIQGIMLAQRQWVLQPYDLRAEVIGDRSPVVVKISGSFLLFDDTTEPDIPQQVQITAEFPAELLVKSSTAEQ
jgi:hypothetical protein